LPLSFWMLVGFPCTQVETAKFGAFAPIVATIVNLV
jgi:hypothetical protein